MCCYQSSSRSRVRPNLVREKSGSLTLPLWCGVARGLSRYGFANGYGREPVVAVFRQAVDDIEEGIVQRGGDGAHASVADEDAVDGAEVRYLCGGAGEEGLVADVEELARQCLLDDRDAELAGQHEDRVAGDSVQDRVCQRRGVD